VIQPTTDAVVEALRRMLGDKNLYARFRTGCREVTDQLSWPSLAAQMEGFYAKAILRCSDSSM
jgi:glycosyltransferase involved in cell wall biosynthesis